MANIKSQVKRIRTNEAARLRNQSVKSSLRTAIRSFREAAAAGKPLGRFLEPAVADYIKKAGLYKGR